MTPRRQSEATGRARGMRRGPQRDTTATPPRFRERPRGMGLPRVDLTRAGVRAFAEDTAQERDRSDGERLEGGSSASRHAEGTRHPTRAARGYSPSPHLAVR